jgi:hypothetical protein
MTEQVLFTVERNGVKAEIVEQKRDCVSTRFVRIQGEAVDALGSGSLGGTGYALDLTPDQGDMIGALASIARANCVQIKLLQKAGEEKRIETFFDKKDAKS